MLKVTRAKWLYTISAYLKGGSSVFHYLASFITFFSLILKIFLFFFYDHPSVSGSISGPAGVLCVSSSTPDRIRTAPAGNPAGSARGIVEKK